MQLCGIFFIYFLKQCDIEIGKTKQGHCIIDIEKIAVHSYYNLRRKSDLSSMTMKEIKVERSFSHREVPNRMGPEREEKGYSIIPHPFFISHYNLYHLNLEL